MPGRILIIDALTNRRIHLRARLDPASCDIALAESRSEAMAMLRDAVPDIIIVADDLPGLKLQQFCKALRLDPKTQFVTVMVAVPRENHSARICALNAGAADVIEYANDPADLRARIRSVMRQKQGADSSGLVAGRVRGIGFAEPQRGFAKPVVVTVVADEGTVPPLGASRHPDLTLRHSSQKDLRQVAGRDTDVFVICESSSPTESRNLLGALRSTAETCRAGILYVARHPTGSSVPSPLDFGAHDLVTKSVSDDELRLRVARLAQRKQDADFERAELNSLGEKAYTDMLTGLSNRGYAEDFLRKYDQSSGSRPGSVAVLLADVDHFKTINDLHGHAAGDEILRTVGSVLKSHLRSTDLVSRFGGEEFLIALPETGTDHALLVADRLRRSLSERSTTLDTGMVVNVTISIGIAVSTRGFHYTSADLRRAADNALYRAKRKGRNRTEIALAEDYLLRQAIAK